MLRKEAMSRNEVRDILSGRHTLTQKLSVGRYALAANLDRTGGPEPIIGTYRFYDFLDNNQIIQIHKDLDNPNFLCSYFA
jgi:hypothetical protein